MSTHGSEKHLIVQEQKQAWKSWKDKNLQGISPIRFKRLISAERTDSYGIVLGVCTIPPGGVLVNHSHPKEEIYYILTGQGVVEIDGEARPVSDGAAVFIPNNAEHSLKNVGTEQLKFLYTFPADTLDGITYTFRNDA